MSFHITKISASEIPDILLTVLHLTSYTAAIDKRYSRVCTIMDSPIQQVLFQENKQILLRHTPELNQL